ncbi:MULTISPECIES: TetR/AcrR family transcriptional regulator [unclassified Streptomyces]|uniref:TetR/AcrR family transcriptional regulator n=1 Tax=unclassified Streptomyces TaxID=2593676 RepID=UPI00088C5C04|nr:MULTISPECIES: TetR/AcrR family transcriptional regulator [unclassified Streptomyces]MDX2730469.1 TetR/AcrR family transcriptional regulator [Streptomyces sp. PA03-2a]SCZ14922.1 DNA-binding transcriptional regulator, AcrR family [Streptomyces sp. 136MFCol5.1]
MADAATVRCSRITPAREAELYAVVLDLLREVGYDALTMDAVSVRARTSKATLYRQWGSKPELVVKALRRQKPVSIDESDTGSLRGDFHEMVMHADDYRMEQDTSLMRGLAMAVRENADLLGALRELLFDPETIGLDRMLRRAMERGEIRADNPTLEYVPHMLVGALVVRGLIDNQPPTQAFLTSYIDAVVLPALGA